MFLFVSKIEMTEVRSLFQIFVLSVGKRAVDGMYNSVSKNV
jgi:hypothetical protein